MSASAMFLGVTVPELADRFPCWYFLWESWQVVGKAYSAMSYLLRPGNFACDVVHIAV